MNTNGREETSLSLILTFSPREKGCRRPSSGVKVSLVTSAATSCEGPWHIRSGMFSFVHFRRPPIGVFIRFRSVSFGFILPPLSAGKVPEK
jgi:hypothetical protein